jgi:hypothetical protein
MSGVHILFAADVCMYALYLIQDKGMLNGSLINH